MSIVLPSLARGEDPALEYRTMEVERSGKEAPTLKYVLDWNIKVLFLEPSNHTFSSQACGRKGACLGVQEAYSEEER